mmetsp:Transcript_61285/g.150810  ORF Transcript_61285/g.150810 Transcript_61285/m.150810 type:complete len:241 (-) Transcript_61285:435-1157(-)
MDAKSSRLSKNPTSPPPSDATGVALPLSQCPAVPFFATRDDDDSPRTVTSSLGYLSAGSIRSSISTFSASTVLRASSSRARLPPALVLSEAGALSVGAGTGAGFVGFSACLGLLMTSSSSTTSEGMGIWLPLVPVLFWSTPFSFFALDVLVGTTALRGRPGPAGREGLRMESHFDPSSCTLALMASILSSSQPPSRSTSSQCFMSAASFSVSLQRALRKPYPGFPGLARTAGTRRLCSFP